MPINVTPGSVEQNHTSPDIPSEIHVTAIPGDERIWVPQGDNLWFRPLMLNTVNGGWCNLLRVKRSGVVSRHVHPAPVHGFVLKGAWRYLEHDWIARAGDYIFEPPGEIHTLVVDAATDADEMISFFHISGAMMYLDDKGNTCGYEDAFTKIEMCRRHYAQVGLDGYVDQFIR